MLKKSEFDPQIYRDAMARFAGAVHVLTTDGPAGRRGTTVIAACSVSDRPPTILVCINRENVANSLFSENGRFVLNTLADTHRDLANGFSGLTGLSQDDRFALGSWTTLSTGAPVLTNAAAAFDCELAEWTDMATHRILYGKVTGVRIGDSFSPLMYYNRSYRVLLRFPIAMADLKPRAVPASIDATLDMLAAADYVADRALATVLFLSLRMKRPLFLEGEAGVGKTEIAKVLASSLGRRLIRLQCYEGLDVSSAVYEWNYAAQMIEIRMEEAAGKVDRRDMERNVFSEKYLIRRPVLEALTGKAGAAPVFLIDELDRTDEAFEAYLLEILSDFQVTVPELGTISAEEPPIVIITTNRTREIHDALKRRCLYHWVDYPDAARELDIVRRKVPQANRRLSAEVVNFIQKLRELDLFKAPGVAETIDWASALTELDKVALDPETVSDTIGVLLKYQDDIAKLDGTKVKEILDDVRAQLRAAE